MDASDLCVRVSESVKNKLFSGRTAIFRDFTAVKQGNKKNE